MNIQRYLILIKGEDKTEEILNFNNDKYYIHINYRNAEKNYTYAKKDFEFYKDPIEIDIQKYRINFKQGYAYNISKVLKFDKYYRIFFDNNTSIVGLAENIEIIEKDDQKILSSNKFEYFKDISKIVSVKTEEGTELLTKEYEKINFIKKDTALYKYLNPKEKNGNELKQNLDKLIFPFGANKSQFEAVRNAINNQISIIEGPPRNWKNSDYIKYYCKHCKRWQNSCSSLK